jgi:hypothetical protein
MFVFLSYLIFSFFLYISFLYVPKYLTTMYLLCTDVGPVCPAEFARMRWHPRLEGAPTAVVGLAVEVGEPPAREAERVLIQVERNLTALTHTVPMAEIEDLPPSMQLHVVGLPRTWVHLFQHSENVFVPYGRANKPRD